MYQVPHFCTAICNRIYIITVTCKKCPTDKLARAKPYYHKLLPPGLGTVEQRIAVGEAKNPQVLPNYLGAGIIFQTAPQLIGDIRVHSSRHQRLIILALPQPDWAPIIQFGHLRLESDRTAIPGRPCFL